MTPEADGAGSDGGPLDRVDMGRPWQQLRWVVVDVEGNGQRPPDLVEAACVPVDDGVPGAARTWLVRPSRPITRPVQRIHGIGNGDVTAAPCVADVAGELRAALAGRVVIGHHVHVDLSVLGRELGGWAPAAAVDTLRLAKAVWPGLPSYSLGKLTAGSVSPPGTGDRHRAGHDAALTARLFLALAAAAGELPAPGGGGPVTAARLLSLAGVPVPSGAAEDDTSRLF